MPYLGQAVFPTRSAGYDMRGGKPHLGLVISDPERNADEIVFVTVTSAAAECDRSCVLAAVDHPSLTHESVAYYRITLKGPTTAQAMENAWTSGWFAPRPDLKPDVLKRVQRGAFETKWLAPWAERVLSEQGFRAA